MRIEASLNKLRKSRFSVTPINFLPDEILARIFQWVTHAQSLGFEKLIDETPFPENTLAIAQVCARWRRVAFGSRSIGSHIDLSIDDRVVSLAKSFAYHSRDQPLSIRVIEPLERWKANDSPTKLNDFISVVGPSTGSLEFTWDLPIPCLVPSSQWPQILEHSISCAAKGLTRLTLSVRDVHHTHYETGYAHWYLVTTHSTMHSRDGASRTVILSGIREELYENILLSIKSLSLDRIYPLWTSKAYHGLLDLRLNGPRETTFTITIQQFANSLAASPGLRVLHFGLEVGFSGGMPQPIHLEILKCFCFNPPSLRRNTVFCDSFYLVRSH
ncbi:hypothetical protein RSAG8_06721, partial [Rhizoctonia solani AG-8 WAC10335]